MPKLKIYRDPHNLGCISFIVSDRLGTENPVKTEEINEILKWGEAAFDGQGRLVYLSDWTFPQSFPTKIKILQKNPGVIAEHFDIPELGLFNVLLWEVLQTLYKDKEFVAKDELVATSSS